MSPSSSPALRVSVLVIAALCLFGGGLAFGLASYQTTPELSPSPVSPAIEASVKPASLPPPALAPAPAFDVVRVAPDGGAVIAGRAEPGAIVTVQENGQALGQARADGHGSWVMIPATPLPPGAGELTVTAQTSTGPRPGEASVLVVVPSPPLAPVPSGPRPAPASPLALLMPPAAPSRLLQAPAMPNAPAPAAPGRKLGLDTVDYDEHGAIRFSGSAPPNAPVRMYVDNTPVGDAKAGTDGHWAMSRPPRCSPASTPSGCTRSRPPAKCPPG